MNWLKVASAAAILSLGTTTTAAAAAGHDQANKDHDRNLGTTSGRFAIPSPTPATTTQDQMITLNSAASASYPTSITNRYTTPPTTCLTEAACNAHRKRLNIPNMYYYTADGSTMNNQYGCFSKYGKAYFGSGGTISQMADNNLSGVRKRIMCDDSLLLTRDPTLSPSVSPSVSPTLVPTKNPAWKDDGWIGDGHDGKKPTLSP